MLLFFKFCFSFLTFPRTTLPYLGEFVVFDDVILSRDSRLFEDSLGEESLDAPS